jgi:hypothetical protein
MRTSSTVFYQKKIINRAKRFLNLEQWQV